MSKSMMSNPSVAELMSSEAECLMGDYMRDVLFHYNRMWNMDWVGLWHWDSDWNFVIHRHFNWIRHRSINVNGNRDFAVHENGNGSIHRNVYFNWVVHGSINYNRLGEFGATPTVSPKTII